MSILDELDAPLRRLKDLHGDPLRVSISVDGAITVHPVKLPYRAILKLIGAETTDTVNFLDREHVMLVDDVGHKRNLAPNPLATVLYWERCGGPNKHTICGPVYICPDEDFA